MNKIPIFIIVHNQYETLKKSVVSYEKYIKTPIEIIFHDVCSSYFETTNYLETKQNEGYKVYRSEVNNHHTVMNSIKDYISKNPDCEYVVMTDPDIELYNVNGDILEFYIYLLNKFNKISIGPMLKIDDIPDEYYNKRSAIIGHTKQFWSRPRKTILFKNQNYQYIECVLDTTFQLFSSKKLPPYFPHHYGIRTLEPYSARHLDWYINPNNMTPCQLFCSNNSSKISHWNNKKWTGKYQTTNLNVVNNFYKNKNKYVYYYNNCGKVKQKVETTRKMVSSIPTIMSMRSIFNAVTPVHNVKENNCSNFGDCITPFIYESFFLKRPIIDLKGGKNKEDVVFGAGSILNNSRNNSIIWGTGFMYGTEIIQKPKKILSVRGPLTRKRLLELDIKCPENYGDIGLILPYFYFPEVKKKYKLGIIPDYIDKNTFKKIYKSNDKNVKIIDVIQPVQNVINDILSCEVTMSSSLHGIIVSHAYNVKCMWIKITDKIGGDTFKFRDYYGSLDIDNYNEMLPYSYSNQISTSEAIELINNYSNPKFPINTKSIIELCPFVNIKPLNI
jgi:pyruvyltransferase